MSGNLSPWVEQLLDRVIQMLQNETFRKKIQLMVLQPFLHWCIELVFPYVILLCVLFGVLIVLMVSIVGLLVYQVRGAGEAIGKSMSSS